MQLCLSFSRLGKPLLQLPLIPSILCPKRSHRLPGGATKQLQFRAYRLSAYAAPLQKSFQERWGDAECEVKDDQTFEGEVEVPSWESGYNITQQSWNPDLLDRPSPLIDGGVAGVGLAGQNAHSSSKRPPGIGALSGTMETLTPSSALGAYLDLDCPLKRADLFQHVIQRVDWQQLPIVLMYHLHTSSIRDQISGFGEDEARLSKIPSTIHQRITDHRIKSGFTVEDVAAWAHIMSGWNADEQARRLLSSDSAHPPFLLLLILRHDLMKVGILNKLLVYTHDVLSSLEPNALEVLLHRLLRQTRRIYPAAVVSVMYMLKKHVETSFNLEDIEPKTRSRLSKLLNGFLRVLALPSSIEPYHSMTFNWKAQKIILELMANSDPSLLLDQNSFRAVVRVLLASKKSPNESRTANLRSGAWPPWRMDQDGMDARRLLEEDESRVIRAIKSSRETGYSDSALYEHHAILGGQESDGTPTIHTRTLSKWPRGRTAPTNFTPRQHRKYHVVSSMGWAARISATRDARQAWMAFMNYKASGKIPSLAMYFAMFKKLEYESARMGRHKARVSTPGDGLEVHAPLEDNFSVFYERQHRPPSLPDLYAEMKMNGLRPSGQCLLFLIRHAKTMDVCLQYLRDSINDPNVLAQLNGDQTLSVSPQGLDKMGNDLFAAYIHALCRFAPRAVCTENPPELEGKSWEEYMTPGRRRPQPLKYPLLHAAYLLGQKRSTNRSAWIPLFRALAQRNVILLPNDPLGDPRNDEASWRVSIAVLGDYFGSGLEVDPTIFMSLCHTFEKFAKARIASEGHFKTFASQKATRKLKNTYSNVTRINTLEWLPRCLYPIRGHHLHAYIRCMGIIRDCNEIVSVLNWMVQQREDLEARAEQAANGYNSLRLALVAVRYFCSGFPQEVSAKEIIEGSNLWGGWPTDEEIELYGVEPTMDEMAEAEDGKEREEGLVQDEMIVRDRY